MNSGQKAKLSMGTVRFLSKMLQSTWGLEISLPGGVHNRTGGHTETQDFNDLKILGFHTGPPPPQIFWSRTSQGWIRSMSWDALRMASTGEGVCGPAMDHVSSVVGALVLPFVFSYTPKGHPNIGVFPIDYRYINYIQSKSHLYPNDV